MNNNYLAIDVNDDVCAYCLGDDLPLIKPCQCSKFHIECLDENRSKGRGDAMTTCQTCRFNYVMDIKNDDPESERKRLLKFRLYVIFDILYFILWFIQLSITLGYFSYLIDDKEYIYNYFKSDIVDNEKIIYGLCGLVVLLFIIGISGALYQCCHEGGGRGPHFIDCGGGIDSPICLLLIFIIFVICGVVFIVIYGYTGIKQIIIKQKEKIWNRLEVKKYVVKDFSNKENELKDIIRMRNEDLDRLLRLYAPHVPAFVRNDRPRGY